MQTCDCPAQSRGDSELGGDTTSTHCPKQHSSRHQRRPNLIEPTVSSAEPLLQNVPALPGDDAEPWDAFCRSLAYIGQQGSVPFTRWTLASTSMISPQTQWGTTIADGNCFWYSMCDLLDKESTFQQVANLKANSLCPTEAALDLWIAHFGGNLHTESCPCGPCIASSRQGDTEELPQWWYVDLA